MNGLRELLSTIEDWAEGREFRDLRAGSPELTALIALLDLAGEFDSSHMNDWAAEIRDIGWTVVDPSEERVELLAGEFGYPKSKPQSGGK